MSLETRLGRLEADQSDFDLEEIRSWSDERFYAFVAEMEAADPEYWEWLHGLSDEELARLSRKAGLQ